MLYYYLSNVLQDCILQQKSSFITEAILLLYSFCVYYDLNQRYFVGEMWYTHNCFKH